MVGAEPGTIMREGRGEEEGVGWVDKAVLPECICTLCVRGDE